jgi:hypothetical protein
MSYLWGRKYTRLLNDTNPYKTQLTRLYDTKSYNLGDILIGYSVSSLYNVNYVINI